MTSDAALPLSVSPADVPVELLPETGTIVVWIVELTTSPSASVATTLKRWSIGVPELAVPTEKTPTSKVVLLAPGSPGPAIRQ